MNICLYTNIANPPIDRSHTINGGIIVFVNWLPGSTLLQLTDQPQIKLDAFAVFLNWDAFVQIVHAAKLLFAE